MMKRTYVICLALSICFCLSAPGWVAAGENGSNGIVIAEQVQDEASGPVMPDRKNAVKINLTSLLFSGISVQFERVITPRLSLSAGVNYRPEGQVPFVEFIKNTFTDEDQQNAHRFLDEAMISYMTITPEIRFYPGSNGAPNGFYIAPYLRYGSWDMTSQLEFDRDDDPSVELRFLGDMRYYSGGLMLGFQYVRDRLTIDGWLLGPFIGSVDGSFDVPNFGDIDLTEEEKKDIEQDFNDIDAGILDVSAKIGDDRMDVLIGGGILGIRAIGFTIGFRF